MNSGLDCRIQLGLFNEIKLIKQCNKPKHENENKNESTYIID